MSTSRATVKLTQEAKTDENHIFSATTRSSGDANAVTKYGTCSLTFTPPAEGFLFNQSMFSKAVRKVAAAAKQVSAKVTGSGYTSISQSNSS